MPIKNFNKKKIYKRTKISRSTADLWFLHWTYLYWNWSGPSRSYHRSICCDLRWLWNSLDCQGISCWYNSPGFLHWLWCRKNLCRTSLCIRRSRQMLSRSGHLKSPNLLSGNLDPRSNTFFGINRERVTEGSSFRFPFLNGQSFSVQSQEVLITRP